MGRNRTKQRAARRQSTPATVQPDGQDFGRPFAESAPRVRIAALVAAAAFVAMGLSYLIGDLAFDECITIGDQIERPFAECFLSYSVANNHILYSATLWLWVHLFGRTTEVFMRLPGLFMALASFYLLYYSGKRLLGQRVAGLIMMLILVFSPVYLGFFYQLRGYGLSILLAIVATIGVLHIVRGERRRGLAIFALGALPLPGVIPGPMGSCRPQIPSVANLSRLGVWAASSSVGPPVSVGNPPTPSMMPRFSEST